MFSICKDSVGRTVMRVNPKTPQDVLATLRLASVDFGFLVHRGESLDAREFAERICATYGQSPRRDAVVRALHSQPMPIPAAQAVLAAVAADDDGDVQMTVSTERMGARG